uniref:Uncharacterized protein n=1 Tax=virus sp. ctFlR8 TaxID=2825811 RepID=A0A8S5RN22_9VIRU|nr:MAG TPA: hypothetical protein [virus sp. ctFlR8]DAH03497.1 MAG TPA: hypothetical protein [Caudoviricetes sp.]DAZ21960.1 MAG TPA: hypothetical protein [Caudoviricetes sp.]
MQSKIPLTVPFITSVVSDHNLNDTLTDPLFKFFHICAVCD